MVTPEAQTAAPREPPVLRMRGIVKEFPGVRALQGVDLTLGQGEVLAVLGENGAGKSTLIKILSADYERDSGEIELFGKPVQFRTPKQAMDAGIRVIYQELNNVPELTVAENISMGDLPTRTGLVDWAEVRSRALKTLRLLDAQLDLNAKVVRLNVAAKQIVEIARALHARARIIVMDEPTAPLSQHEVERLFEVIAALKGQGVSVIYISHRLEEVFKVADRVMVLRDGRNAGLYEVGETNFRTLVRAMVGRDLAEMYPRKASHPGEVVLRVERLSRRGAFKELSFDVRRGEILGVFGLLGSGRNELSLALAGALPVDDGMIQVEGKSYRFRSPKQAKRVGVGLVPVERKLEGLVLSMSIKDNVTLPTMSRFARWGIFDRGLEEAHTRRWMKELGIRAPNIRQLVVFLSGGTQQKVVLAKWLEAQTKVLVMDEPTRGVDVGAKAEIYQILERLAEEGMAIVLSSSELPEILSMSDRVMVLHRGEIEAILNRGEANQEKLLALAMGGQATEAGEQSE